MTDIPVRIRPEVAALPPYRQGKQAAPGAFKLSSNENPFEPLPGVVEAMHRATGVNRYPDASAARLRDRLAERFGVTAEGVHIAAGSVSILHQLALAACGPGDELLMPWRSFEAYPGLATITGATPVQVPLDAASANDLAAMADRVTERTRLILVCTPNNPTGPTVSQADFDAFLARVPRDVLIALDEAYYEFVTDPGAVRGERVIAAGHPNVVVLRTFSKAYGLAGLRVGYAIGHPRVLDAARTVGIPLSVTAAAEEAALASLDAEAALLDRVAEIVARRERLVAGLRAAGLQVPDSQANFVWLPLGEKALAAAEAFDAAGLIVRPFDGDGVRISVGEADAVDQVIRTAESVVETLTTTA